VGGGHKRAFQDAAAIFRETDDRHGESIAVGNLERDQVAQATEIAARTPCPILVVKSGLCGEAEFEACQVAGSPPV
jgi:hypothetical protein